ncbi:nischarin isoform X1 [Scleropages formosus]|uniref:nischarin isoform X1 n=1 Tax=Scleropages formosus TaxID=113540 RepID=UPI000878FBAB|nr:nischarin isoform X1 [Scleropages formosus]
MERTAFPDDAAVQRRVRIVGSELVENYTVYIIEVTVGSHQWSIKHRYSDFHELHEKLTAEKKIDKNLLPPKKMIGKNSRSLVEKRQKELEVYLETLLVKFPFAAPKVLSCFLHFHFYEINGITAALAEELFHKGEQLLVAGEVFLLRPLQLYAITQQLRLATPTCANGDAKADLGHILDFTCRLKYLKIPGTRGTVGTSNIQEHLLPFDLSIFKSLLQIEISHCESQQIKGLPSLKPSLATMSIHYCAASMKDILVPEASEFAQWEVEGVASDCPVTAVIPTWKMLTTLDMSHNSLKCIDESVKLIPKVEFLDLSYNDLTLVENLQHLYNLIHLDLSYNKLTTLEGVHTKLGNIKTLNLAGNQLESLLGLNKLYSLVNLDLSSNKLAQLDEIKNIGTLPCLEKLSLTNNPMCIIPDYRTKVLAQFWDRASEVCLDRTPTTEKELDTVEVLKAIQKAKEAKDRMANSEKKISEDCRAPTGETPSSSSCCSLAAPPSSPPQPPSASSSQEIICKEENNQIVTPVDSLNTQRCNFFHDSSCEETLQITQQLPSCLSLEITTDQQISCCGCVEDCAVWLDARSVPVVPLALISYTAASLELAAELSALVGKAARELEKEVCSERDGLSVEGAEPGSPGSGDGYFEVSRGSRDTCQAGGPQAALEEPGPGPVRVSKVVWALGVRVGPSTRHLLACVVLTEPWLAVFRVRNGEQPLGVADIVAELEAELLVPYTDIEAVTLDVPDLCLSLKVRPSGVILYLLSDSQSLMEMHAHLSTLVTGSPPEPQGGTATAQAQLIRQLLNPWEYEANDYVVKGAFPAHLLHSAKVTSEGPPCSDVPSEMWSSGVDEGSASLPCVLFLTPRHLCILRLDFATLAGGPRSSMRLSRVPLASVLVHPRQACYGSGPPPERGFRDGHVLELLAGRELVTAVFLLPHDKFLFLSLFSQLRSGLRDIKTVAFLQARLCHRKNRNHQMHVERTQKVPVNSLPPAVQRPRLKLSLLHPDSSLTRRLSEENQCPSHLALSPSLGFLSGRQGDELLEFFHSSVAEVENEELAHVLWSSVLFYQFPDLELTACIMLSTKALYFILDDSAATLSGQAVLWNWQPTEDQEADFIISYCFAMKLQDLHSVNVGLFDQYFRVVGPSPSHVIACLTRDSYGTHRFLQQLMAVLSSLEKLPSPEPPEQDFYSQFGKNNTGKMKNYELVHSSKVKFVYPSEEEIGDLTFIVAEKKSSCGHSRAFNILLYVLAFQVQSSYPGPGTPPEHHLQPKTLILTSTDVFLLDEDYISYPLPDFAKEPPQRDKYRLTDARRIRDLDRVLMGYQTYPQALTLVFDDIPGPDLLCHLTLDHFAEEGRAGGWGGARASRPSVDQSEVQWCVFVPGADARERLISLLARQWEALCSRELPVELTG